MLKLKSFGHINIVVDNMDEATQFYRESLGAVPVQSLVMNMPGHCLLTPIMSSPYSYTSITGAHWCIGIQISQPHEIVTLSDVGRPTRAHHRRVPDRGSGTALQYPVNQNALECDTGRPFPAGLGLRVQAQ